MAIGERIHFFRLLRGMTQKYLGMSLGFPETVSYTHLDVYKRQPLPGGNVQQDVLVLSRPQHIAVSRVAHEPLSAQSRSPTSQTVMRSGSFIPYHTPNHIRQNMFKHGCLHRNSCSRHRSRGSWSTAP